MALGMLRSSIFTWIRKIDVIAINIVGSSTSYAYIYMVE